MLPIPGWHQIQGVSSQEIIVWARARAQRETWYMSESEPSLAQKSHFVPSRALLSFKIQPAFEPEPSLAQKSNMFLSPSWTWLRFWIGFWAEPSQPSSEFLAQSGLSFSELITLSHSTCVRGSTEPMRGPNGTIYQQMLQMGLWVIK